MLNYLRNLKNGGRQASADSEQSLRAERFISMVEGAASYFMMCDLDFRIVYCNPAVVEMLSKYRDDLRKLFPGFDPRRLVGMSIDHFHKNPQHQHRLLSDFSKLPYKTELDLAGMEFGLTLSALRDRQGNHIGNAVEWTDYNARAAYKRGLEKLVEQYKAGDLSAKADLSKLDSAYAGLMEGIHEVAEAIVNPVRHSANQVATASSQISSGSQALAQGASEQASSLEEISSNLQQVGAMTKQNSDNAQEARGLTDSTREVTQKGVSNMQELSEAINRIQASADETSKIVKTIDEIAFQTNLLALNAAVEAARAGDAGRGFAVVAEEVRNLAMRSAEAAKSTSGLIEESVKNAESGVSMNAGVLSSLQEINGQVQKVAEVVAEIAAASDQQRQGIEQVTSAIEQLNQVTQQTAANAEEAAATSEELSGQAEEMLALVNGSAGEGRRKPRQGSSGYVNGKTSKHLPPAPGSADLIPFDDGDDSQALGEF